MAQGVKLLYRYTVTPTEPPQVSAGSANKNAPLTLEEGDWNFLELETKKAPVDSPIFTGTPKAPNPTNGDSSQQLVTTNWFMNNIDGGTY
jgi:hypothetical protein